jgi:beta-RFAP synthase
MIRVHTGGRLHFGVFRFGGGERYFGGAGMMIDAPGVVVSVQPADAWSGENERALAFARQFAASFPADAVGPHHVAVDAALPEHAGLGSGTQLGLAVAAALARSAKLGELPIADLAQRVGRGRRSALGVHGFARGGFLVEAGKRDPATLAPLVARLDFPDDWRLVLTLPEESEGLHGPAEIAAFRHLHEAGVTLPTDALCRLVLLGMLPALAERDLASFGAALHEFNHKVGEAFATVQGGPYAGARVAEVVEFLRRDGIAGVAQSSWGPTVCAVVEDVQRAERVAHRVRAALPGRSVVLAAARREGATLEQVG